MLRIGRTKAYAMAREWRVTEGRSGLPVLDFGSVLRVPRHALEKLIGGPLASADQPTASDAARESPPPPSNIVELTPPDPDIDAKSLVTPVASAPRTRRRRPRPVDPASQPSLPFTG